MPPETGQHPPKQGRVLAIAARRDRSPPDPPAPGFPALAKSPRRGEYVAMYRRHIEPALHAALADTRVVLLNGARQTGKSTLAEELAAAQGGRYLTLDDETLLSTARS